MLCSVCVSALALLKMAMHAKSGGNIEVMGMLQGKCQVRHISRWCFRRCAVALHRAARCISLLQSCLRLPSQLQGCYCTECRSTAVGQGVPANRACLKHLQCGATVVCSRHCFCIPQLCLQGDTFIIIDVFALPVEGTETRVNAQEEAYEYMFQYLETNKARQALLQTCWRAAVFSSVPVAHAALFWVRSPANSCSQLCAFQAVGIHIYPFPCAAAIGSPGLVLQRVASVCFSPSLQQKGVQRLWWASLDKHLLKFSCLTSPALQQVGRLENVVGWYHSHPGYGCWLSGIDVGTQHTQQVHMDPFLAIVIDPHRTIAAGKVEIGAFRTYPEVSRQCVIWALPFCLRDCAQGLQSCRNLLHRVTYRSSLLSSLAQSSR